jgi:serine/threonine protein kinase
MAEKSSKNDLKSFPPPGAHETISAGEYIDGKYLLVKLMAKGGMGEVYEAVHEKLSKRCVVKFLKRELAFDGTMLRRFFNEARMAASTHSLSVPDVYDFGYFKGKPYYIMEFVEGETFEDIIRKGCVLDSASACGLVTLTCDALKNLHGRKIIHRDLKPSNLMLTQIDGVKVIKLLDLGISLLLSTSATRLTSTGTLMGTLFYMSPEQALCEKDIDHRTDIYSLGAIFYEMLTGKVPFGTEDEASTKILMKIIRGEPPDPRTYNPLLDEKLSGIVLQAMRKKREERYQTVEALKADVEEYLRELREQGTDETIAAVHVDHDRRGGEEMQGADVPKEAAPTDMILSRETAGSRIIKGFRAERTKKILKTAAMIAGGAAILILFVTGGYLLLGKLHVPSKASPGEEGRMVPAAAAVTAADAAADVQDAPPEVLADEKGEAKGEVTSGASDKGKGQVSEVDKGATKIKPGKKTKSKGETKKPDKSKKFKTVDDKVFKTVDDKE